MRRGIRGVVVSITIGLHLHAADARAEEPSAPPPGQSMPNQVAFSKEDAPAPARRDAQPAEEKKPSLLSKLPIWTYIATAGAAAIGSVFTFIGKDAREDLRHPERHPTHDDTDDLVFKARAGRVTQIVGFAVSGGLAIWSTIDTISAVRSMGGPKAASRTPRVDLQAGSTGASVTLGGTF